MLVELVRAGVDVAAAGWLKTADGGAWSLYVGSAAAGPGNLGDAYRTVYACLRRLTDPWVDLSDVKLVPASDPIARDLAAARARYPGGRQATRYAGRKLGDLAIEEAYIYPRVTPGLTRDEVVQTVAGLMNRAGTVRPSMITLRDGNVIRGVPYGIEASGGAGHPTPLVVKIRDDVDGSTHTALVDEVTNIQ
ncbi:MAG: hypothetical protein K2X87_01295 [Gemmataceae bacterium]|nr:hypothetical protein [Gemmataceae bacterium]